VSTLRGTGGDILYCEEAAFMDLGVFYEVIVPLMEMRGAATIMISTPLGTFNFYTELQQLRDENGELVFNTRRLSAACHRCRGTDVETECEHPSPDKPSWKLETSAKMRAIFGHRKSLLAREAFGKTADSESLAFQARDLKDFFTAPLVRAPHPPVTRLFVALDPNGGAGEEGGTGSATAIVSFYYNGMNPVVRYVRASALATRRFASSSGKTMRRRLRSAMTASTGFMGSSIMYAALSLSTKTCDGYVSARSERPLQRLRYNGIKYACSKMIHVNRCTRLSSGASGSWSSGGGGQRRRTMTDSKSMAM